MNNSIVTTCMLGVVLGLVATLGGCGDQLLFECHFDTDCAGEQYCVDNQCRSECSGDEDCGTNTYCSTYQREGSSDPLQICMEPEATDEGCETDLQCRQQYDDQQARCGIHGRCVLGSTDQNDTANNGHGDFNQNEQESADSDSWILAVEQLGIDGEPVTDDIEQNQDEEDADESTVLPVRLGAVVVRDEDDSLIGHGRIVSVAPAGDEDPADEELTYPLTEDGICIESPRTAPHTSLGGPGGRAYVELIDDDSAPVVLQEARTVELVANAPECPIGQTSIDDDATFGQFRAFLCNSPDESPDFDECEHHFSGPHSGHTVFDVAFSE